MNNVFFTSDLHLYHEFLIKRKHRPFDSVEEMNAVLQDNINEKVDQGDRLFLLGDLCFKSSEFLCDWLDGLRCKNLFAIKGNHDRSDMKKIEHRFGWYRALSSVTFKEQPIIMCHYAMRVWDRAHYGSWHLYGHSHGNLPEDPNARSMDVGVDTNNYYPYSFEDIKERMDAKTYKAFDHHKEKEGNE